MGQAKTAARYEAELLGKVYKRRHGKSGRSGKYHSKFQHGHFICIDGEGIDTPDNQTTVVYDEQGIEIERVVHQSYALLMSNEDKYIIDVNGLSSEKCFDFLLMCSDDPRAILVCFGASYDANMMLRSIPRYLLRLLHKGRAIDWGKYQISYRPRKELTVREYADVTHKFVVNEDTGRKEGLYKKSVTMWDVFGFFQSSFIDTLDQYFVKGNTLLHEVDEYKLIIAKIAEGKKARGTFTEEQLTSFVMPYCKLEVDALHALMVKLRKYLEDIGMVITRWDGAGACAAAALMKYGIKEHISMDRTPQDVIVASEYAFFGGRIEVLLYGNYEGVVYHYDINSAYPSALIDLPSLSQGTWQHKVFDESIEHNMSKMDVMESPLVSLFLVSWRKVSNVHQTVISPFAWRSSDNRVYFPPEGMAWVWSPEVKMCIDMFSTGKHAYQIHIHEAWLYTPEQSDLRPFAFISELYELRKQFVKTKNGAEKVIKLILNSLYGKMAQSIGYDKDTGKKPPFHNLVAAGLITSLTRSKMMYAVMQKPSDVIMLATDGIYSRKPLQVVGVGSDDKQLGEWEAKQHEYITIVLSGVYFYKTPDAKENAFSRGFDRYTVMRDEVLASWSRNERILKAATTRFVGLGSALATRFSLWCTWRTIQRELGLDMSTVAKREDDSSCTIRPEKGLVRTYAALAEQNIAYWNEDSFPYSLKHPLMSHKYQFDWDDDKIDGVRMREYLEEVNNSTS